MFSSKMSSMYCTVGKNIIGAPKCSMLVHYLTFLNCSSFSYLYSNFVTTKVVTLNLFASFFVLGLQIGSWLLCCIALHIVITLLNTVCFFMETTLFVHLTHLKLPQISKTYLKIFICSGHLIKIHLEQFEKHF